MDSSPSFSELGVKASGVARDAECYPAKCFRTFASPGPKIRMDSAVPISIRSLLPAARVFFPLPAQAISADQRDNNEDEPDDERYVDEPAQRE